MHFAVRYKEQISSMGRTEYPIMCRNNFDRAA